MLVFDRALAARVAERLGRAYGIATDLLKERHEAVRALAAALLRDTTLDAAGVIRTVSGAD